MRTRTTQLRNVTPAASTWLAGRNRHLRRERRFCRVHDQTRRWCMGALGVTQQRPELQAQPRLATPGCELTLGDRVPLVLALPEHHEERGGIGRNVAVDPAGGRLFDRERSIVENVVEPVVSPEPIAVGGLEPGRPATVNKNPRVGRLYDP